MFKIKVKKIICCFWMFFIMQACFSYEPVQTIIITEEDIKNAKPTPNTVSFSKKDLHVIEVMEKRHFTRTYPEFTNAQRLKNLEFELLGRTWQYSPTQDRINKLKLASSNTMLSGTALPAQISSKRMAKRAKNTSIQMRQRDDVGLIDGFLRLINPELYELYRQKSDKFFEMEY